MRKIPYRPSKEISLLYLPLEIETFPICLRVKLSFLIRNYRPLPSRLPLPASPADCARPAARLHNPRLRLSAPVPTPFFPVAASAPVPHRRVEITLPDTERVRALESGAHHGAEGGG